MILHGQHHMSVLIQVMLTAIEMFLNIGWHLKMPQLCHGNEQQQYILNESIIEKH